MTTVAAESLLDMSQEDVDKLCWAVVRLAEILIEHPFYEYQTEVSYRFAESVIINDGEEITLIAARQSGKTEAVAATLAAMMILLPRMALAFPETLGHFKRGLLVGVFAPVGEQAFTMFDRVKTALSSHAAEEEVLVDDEIDDKLIKEGVKTLKLAHCKSLCRSQTAHPKANIESKTYHVIVIDEAQDADDTKVRKSIHPMRASTNGTILKTGSAGRVKCDFWRAIQQNKVRQSARGATRNHFEYDWKRVIKSNPLYRKFIEKEKRVLGEDSDDFQLSYMCVWLLERGMFITEQVFDALTDRTMDIVPRYHAQHLVAGLDVARKVDSTVLTILWVDWEQPDMRTGLLDCRILNWLELPGDPGSKWQSRYNRIVEFLDDYSVGALGIDSQGMGDVVGENLQAMLPNVEVRMLGSSEAEQSERWKHLLNLIQKGMIGWPGKPGAKRTKTWERFHTQMTIAERADKGKWVKVAAPNMADAHDDFVDSLSLATWLPKDESMPQMTVTSNVFFQQRASRAWYAGAGRYAN